MGSVHDRIKLKQAQAAGFAPIRTPDHQSSVRAIPASQSSPVARPPISRRYQMEDYEIRNAFRKQKYIVVDHPLLGEVALNFPNFLVHADMAGRIFMGLEVVGAGFFELRPDGSITAYGRSESLSVDSRPEKDGDLILKTLGLSD